LDTTSQNDLVSPNDHRREAIAQGAKATGDVLSRLRGAERLWHRGGVNALLSIVDAGAISPNDGSLPSLFPGGSEGKLSYGRHIRAVHVFDFDTAELDVVLEYASKWSPFLTDCGTLTVWYEIDRSRLDRHALVLPSDLPGGTVPTYYDAHDAPYKPMHIPGVEAWYKSDLPLSAVVAVYGLRRGTKPRLFVDLGPINRAAHVARQLASSWEADDKRINEERRLNDPNYVSIAEALTANRPRNVPNL